MPSEVAQVAAVRAVAAERRDADPARGTLAAAVCPGLVDTPLSRPWFAGFSQAQAPARAAVAVLDLPLDEKTDPARYGEPVRFGEVVPWHTGRPSAHQERLLGPDSSWHLMGDGTARSGGG